MASFNFSISSGVFQAKRDKVETADNEEIYCAIGEVLQEIKSTIEKCTRSINKSGQENMDGKVTESNFHYNRLQEDPEHEQFHGSPKIRKNKGDNLLDSFEAPTSDVIPAKLLRNLESLKMEIDLHAEEIERLKLKTNTIGRLELTNEQMTAELSRKSEEINRIREEMSLLMTRNKDLSLFQEELKHKLVELGNSRSKLVCEKKTVENMLEVLRNEFDLEEEKRLAEMKQQNELKLFEVRDWRLSFISNLVDYIVYYSNCARW